MQWSTDKEEKMDDNYETLMKLILRICEALVSITEFECCTYGFNAEVKMAKDYIKDYKEEHLDYE